MEYNHLSTRLLESDESLSDRVEAMDFPEKSVYKKTESKALAHCVTSLIHQQTPVISKAIEDYIRKQAEQKVTVITFSMIILRKVKIDLYNSN